MLYVCKWCSKASGFFIVRGIAKFYHQTIANYVTQVNDLTTIQRNQSINTRMEPLTLVRMGCMGAQ